MLRDVRLCTSVQRICLFEGLQDGCKRLHIGGSQICDFPWTGSQRHRTETASQTHHRHAPRWGRTWMQSFPKTRTSPARRIGLPADFLDRWDDNNI